MSRIGKHPVTVPAGVTLTQDGQSITVKGPKGELNFVLPAVISGKLDGDSFSVTPNDEGKEGRAMWGNVGHVSLNGRKHDRRRHKRLPKEFGATWCWLSCANEGHWPDIAARILPRDQLRSAGRHQACCPKANRSACHRYRQAKSWSGCRRDPQF